MSAYSYDSRPEMTPVVVLGVIVGTGPVGDCVVCGLVCWSREPDGTPRHPLCDPVGVIA